MCRIQYGQSKRGNESPNICYFKLLLQIRWIDTVNNETVLTEKPKYEELGIWKNIVEWVIRTIIEGKQYRGSDTEICVQSSKNINKILMKSIAVSIGTLSEKHRNIENSSQPTYGLRTKEGDEDLSSVVNISVV